MASSLRTWPVLVAALALAVVWTSGGCVTPTYQYGSASRYHTSEALERITLCQVECGRPNPVIDTVGWIFGIPSKLTMWNIRMENHNISPETRLAMEEYLARNELTSVKVRFNQYAPKDDWKRLVANKSVGGGWKYTLGTLSWVGETILPGRVFGGDHYNPFTNTVHIYSDIPAVALHEGGDAKDFAQRYYKGTYAAVYLLPVAPLWHEAIATSDAVSYLRAEGGPSGESDAYKVLYPAYGTYVGNAAGGFIPGGGAPIYLAGVLGGHVAGRIQAWRVRDMGAARSSPASPSPDSSSVLPVGGESTDASPSRFVKRADGISETEATRETVLEEDLR